MSRHPPLRAMAVAGFIVLLLCCLLAASYWQYHRATEIAHLNYDRARLASLRGRPEPSGARPLLVVGIGRSNMRADTFYDGRMEEFAAGMGVPLRYVRLARGRGGPRDWRELMADVQAARPDVVVIEAQYLFIPPIMTYWHWNGLHYHADRILREGRKAIWGRSEAEVRKWIMSRESERRRWRRNPGGGVPDDGAAGHLLRISTFGLRDGWQEVFHDCKNAGIAVVLIRLPSADPEFVDVVGDVAPAVDAGMAQISATGLARVLECPIKFRHADFVDGRHMSVSGREKFSAWLIRGLADMRRQ